MRIAFVGTGLAPLRAASGALERAVLAWAAGAERAGHATALLDAPGGRPPLPEIEQFGAEVVVLNNRPAWALCLPEGPGVVQVLHNFDDAWDADPPEIRRGLERRRGVVLAVSQSLAGYIESTYQLSRPVGRAIVPVEEVFFDASWAGRGGPVLFPNRLLEKKGVRFFVRLAKVLSSEHRCQLFSHTAPFDPPTPEQEELLSLVRSSPGLEVLEPPATRAEMAQAYARAGVVVCPSIRPEGLGLVALEAQAVGTPLVTSGLGGLEEVTFPPNEVVGSFEPEEWAAAVERALTGSSREKAGLEVRSCYSQSRATASLLEALRQVT